MAWVEFNEHLYDSPPVEHVGNAAFGMWVRCVIRAAEQEYPGYAISEYSVLRFGTRAMLKKLLTPVGQPTLYTAALLEPATDLDPQQFGATGWYRPVNWQVGSTYRQAFTIRRNRALIPEFLRAKVHERDDYRCVRCGSPENLTLDHIYPHSKGGPDSLSNLQTLCQSCNSKKKDRVE